MYRFIICSVCLVLNAAGPAVACRSGRSCVRPIEEAMEAQRKDAHCTFMTETVGTLVATFEVNKQGCLVGRSQIDGALQLVVLKELQARVLYHW